MFKDVKGFEGLYKVNEEGVIVSTPRNGNGYKEHIMSHSTDSDGYEVCKLRNKDKVITKKIHRAVAEAHLPNPENKPQINHKDGNKKNNHIDNLEWVTASENIRHARQLGLQKTQGEKAVRQVDKQTGATLAVFRSMKEAERQTGIGWTGISATVRGVRKSAGGYFWELHTENIC